MGWLMDLHLSAPWETLEREARCGLLCIRDAVILVDFARCHSAALEVAQAENARLRAALTALASWFDDDCRFDHHGVCQAHMLDQPCSVANARAALSECASKDASA